MDHFVYILHVTRWRRMKRYLGVQANMEAGFRSACVSVQYRRGLLVRHSIERPGESTQRPFAVTEHQGRFRETNQYQAPPVVRRL